MPGETFSVETDRSGHGVQWPWSPHTRFPQLDESFCRSLYKKKTPLVKGAAKLYEATLDEAGFWSGFTSWQHALFYSLPIDTLRRLMAYPEIIRSLGDNAKDFGLLFVHGSNLLRFDDISSPAVTYPSMSNNQFHTLMQSIYTRDLGMCVVMDKPGPVDYVRILPAEVGNLSSGVFKSIFHVADRFFDKTFRSYLRIALDLLCRAREQPWNIITLSQEVRQLFHRGLVGFKPLGVITEWDGDRIMYYATFSFHWLGRNQIKMNESVEPDDTLLTQMLSRCEDPEQNQNDSPSCRVHDKKVIDIPFQNPCDAHMMLTMMAVRWAAGVFWCLAGAGGVGPGDDGIHDDGEFSQPVIWRV
ncbi:hypothetical protein V2A60_008520 [Cordyceps javanica]